MTSKTNYKVKYNELLSELGIMENKITALQMESENAQKEAFKIMANIMSNIEIFVKQLPENNASRTSFKILLKEIYTTLKSSGLERIKTIGEQFDENFFELHEIKEGNNDNKGIIIEELSPGFMFKGKIVAYPKVIIGG